MENRRLLDLKKLCAHYSVTMLYINQHDDDEIVPIPVKRDIYIPLKCYVAIDINSRQLYISQRLINNRNHWLNTLKDDLTYGRLDFHDYC
jgi:hypothetical protein